MQRETLQSIVFFFALMATALALGAALAHLFELPNKMRLSGEEYFIAQKSYSGWNRLAWLLLVEFLSILWLAWLSRDVRSVFWFAIAALAFLLCSQAIFWIFTFPANAATANWTVQPENWAELRRQWEYSHALGAVFQFLVMSSLVVAVLCRGPTPSAIVPG